MNREQLISRIERGWGAFNDAYAGLSEASLIEAGVVERWSVKDLIAHVATWEEEALKALPIIMQGKRPPVTVASTASTPARTRRTAVSACRRRMRRLRRSHQSLLDFVATLPEPWYEMETRFRHRLRLDTWSHYREHTQAILAWRQMKGL